MGMTPLLSKMTCLGFIKKPYHVASDDLVWDPQTSSGPRETVKLCGFCGIPQKSRSSSTFVTFVYHFRKVVELFVGPFCPARWVLLIPGLIFFKLLKSLGRDDPANSIGWIQLLFPAVIRLLLCTHCISQLSACCRFGPEYCSSSGM